MAKEWAKDYQTDFVFIQYRRASYGQQGFLNPDGYSITVKDWAESYK